MLLYEDHKSVVNALAFSADGALLASGSQEGAVFLRGLDGSAYPLFATGATNGAVYGLSFHPEQPLLAIGGEAGWSLFRHDEDDRWLPFGPATTMPTNDLAFLDKSTLAVGLGDRLQAKPGRFELWDVPAGRRIDPVFPELHGVRAVAVCPRKKTVVWASTQRMVNVWDINKQDPVKFPQSNNCLAVAISRDGLNLAVAADWAVRLFEVEKKRERAVLKSHKGRVVALAFSPDGSTLVTGGWDQTVRFWDTASGREREQYQWPVGRVTKLAYAPDGSRLAAGGDTGAVVVWDME